jgi:NAD(P)-dependent dehydrogenase (short-subunit alcohol dehydrogenase family)
MKKNVLITGGAHRLGAALVRAFANQGWRVFLHYDKSEQAAHQLADELNAQKESVNKNVICVKANLSDATERQSLMVAVFKQAGTLQCLINNASQFVPDVADNFDCDTANQQWAVNLMAPMDLTQQMAQHLAVRPVQEPASVIHVLDQKVFNLNPDYFSYTISKLALERAVALQAQGLAPRIRVCGVAPGLMYLSGPQSQANFDKSSKMNLMRKAIDPIDVAHTCLFLAQNQAITGITVCVDNGQHLVASNRDVMFVAQEQ